MAKINVVVIDDVEDILELISYNLQKEGMEAVTFSSPLKAMDYLNSNHTDVIVSDWMMPELDGISLCKKLQSNIVTRNIPIIMLTCKGSIQEYRVALNAGARDYIVKPVRMEEIVRRIKLLLPTVKRYNFG